MRVLFLSSTALIADDDVNGITAVSNAKSYNCDTVPYQVPVRKMEHESTAEINPLLLDSNINFTNMKT